jgi:hypothetical protein
VKLLNDRDVSNTDGINPDSSRQILIEDVFFYCGDDAVAVKSTDREGVFQGVSDITVRDSIILTKKSALKIGTETHAREMKDILFIDNQVIECDRGMSIYVRDGAHVHGVRFIGNRFESGYLDYQQKLIDFEVRERHGRGRISNVLILDCGTEERWQRPSSIIGLSPQHGISAVRFVDYRYAGRVCRSPLEADLKIGSHASQIHFEVTQPEPD